MKIIPLCTGVLIGLGILYATGIFDALESHSCVGYVQPVNIWELALPVPFWLIFMLVLVAFGIGIYQGFNGEDSESKE